MHRGFYCPKARLVVEVDGGQHHGPEEMAKDRVRDKYLRDQGLEVLRFSDREVLVERGAAPGKNLREIAVKRNPPSPPFGSHERP